MPGARFPLTTTEKLDFQTIPAFITDIARRFLEAGFQLYLVGGAVRDLLRGQEPGDWDLASDALPEQVERIFPQTIPSGKQFGTILVINEGFPVEITTFREDLGYSDGRRPDQVRFGKDLQLDLARRDFTINAIAFDLKTRELVDPFNGRRDLQRRLLRSVGDPQLRFREDGLRMFRFYRFLATLNLRPDPLTEKAINPAWARGTSLERIRDEFSKLLLGAWVGRGLAGLKKSGLLKEFLPELADSDRIKQGPYHRWNLWEHSVRTTENINPELRLRLAALLHDIAKPVTRSEDAKGVHFYGHDQRGAEIGRLALERLHYPGKVIEEVVPLIRWHMFHLDQQTGDGAIRRLIARVGPEHLAGLLELRRADIIATGRVDYQTWESWRYISERILTVLNGKPGLNPFALDITGNDLLETFNLQPGQLIGAILAYLKERILDEPDLNQRAHLLELAGEYLKNLDH